MRKSVLALFGLCLCFSSAGISETLKSTERRNNALHVGGSFAIGAMAQFYVENVFVSFGGCMLVGAGKEAIDYYSDDPNRTADIKDIYWNALGCALGVAGVKGVQMYQASDATMLGYQYHFR
jgi:hypothetical protein